MSGVDKAKNAVEKAAGEAKEALGRVAGDEETEDEGKREQTSADLKSAGEKVKDALTD